MEEATSEELKGLRSSREIGASGREAGAISRAQHGTQTEDTERGGMSADLIAKEAVSVRSFGPEVNTTHTRSNVRQR